MLSTICGIIFLCWLISACGTSDEPKRAKKAKHKDERDWIFDYYAYWADDDEG